MYISSRATLLQRRLSACLRYGICIFGGESNKKGDRYERNDYRFDAGADRRSVEADRLVLKRGENVMVTSMTNFVSVKDDRAVIQVAPFSGPGVNGVGGVTVDGRISEVDFRVSRKGAVSLSMYVSGAVASCKVTFTLPKNGTTATVRIDPNYSSNDISLVGRIVPTELSTVYEGLSL